jgi:hypothetical protein
LAHILGEYREFTGFRDDCHQGLEWWCDGSVPQFPGFAHLDDFILRQRWLFTDSHLPSRLTLSGKEPFYI